MTRPVQIVAEAAQGFEGHPRQAVLLARAAAAAGADAVKFQLVYADELAVRSYQHFELFRTLEMPDPAWEDVAAEARRTGIALAFDVYGGRSLALAARLNAAAIKIHSTDFFNDDLIDAAIDTDRDVWFSVGGITVDEVRAFVDRRRPRRDDQLTLLYGFQAEPTAVEDNHLRRLAAWRQIVPTVGLGFMDHAAGTSGEAGWLGVLALSFGIRVLEKHITLGRALGLEDDISAVDAVDFQQYVGRVRAAERALGDPDITPIDAERRYRRRALKVVVATRRLQAGDRVDGTAVALKRAALDDGVPVFERLADVIGRRIVSSADEGAPLAPAHFEP
jgi:N,N'-diacetyllegionaminate synthase